MSPHDLLATAPIFRDFSPEELDALAALCEPSDLGPGDTLFNAGSPGDAIYLVALGTIEMTFPGHDKRLARFGNGQIFGLAALLLDEGYPGTTVAVETTRLVKIPATTLNALLAKDPALAAKFYRAVARYFAFHGRGIAAELDRPYF
jgi:CRP-like cAMP-binding protein